MNYVIGITACVLFILLLMSTLLFYKTKVKTVVITIISIICFIVGILCLIIQYHSN